MRGSLGRAVCLGGEVVAVTVLAHVQEALGGEYCHGHANENNLRYQAGFYCPVSVLYLYYFI